MKHFTSSFWAVFQKKESDSGPQPKQVYKTSIGWVLANNNQHKLTAQSEA